MQSPSVEWALAIGHLAVLDYLRSRGDADHDTISEVVRNVLYQRPQTVPLGKAGFVIGAALLYRHIFRE